MAAALRYLGRVFRVSWLIPACLLPLMLIPPIPQLALGIVMWYFVLVGRIVGTEHFEVGIGAGPTDAVGCGASVAFYLILCAGIAGVWHVMAERGSEDRAEAVDSLTDGADDPTEGPSRYRDEVPSSDGEPPSEPTVER